MDSRVLDALTRIELQEAELLSWGAVGAEWTRAEILELLAESGDDESILDRLVDAFLVVNTPTGGFRSRSAETVRLLATLRQSFRGGPVSDGQPLVLDHRFLHRPRRRPRRDVPAREVLADIEARVGDVGRAAARLLVRDQLSGFQRRGACAVLDALINGESTGVMVTAGTGSGKTLAFYLPLLSWLTDQKPADGRGNTLVLALYPRNELLKDQLRSLMESAITFAAASGGGPTLSLATWFGQTPTSPDYVSKGWADGWTKRPKGFVCPYLRCLKCDGELLWLNADLKKNTAKERLTCTDLDCGAIVDGSVLRLTRESARDRPADIMLTTTESLNRQLSAPGNLAAFGIRPASLTAVLLDEVHIYEGTTGAQNAILFRRLKNALRSQKRTLSLVWVGLSATLRNAGEFFAKLVDLGPGDVAVVKPETEELEESGAEYLVALRHNPFSRTGPLSTTIQTCMALGRSLDHLGDPIDPKPSSSGVFGNKVFVFTDKLDSTNRLYWDLSDAEGWAEPNKPIGRQPVTLAHLRSENQGRIGKDDHREPASAREADGQWWWLAEQLGHGVEADHALVVGRTSSQDRGVTADAQVVVATATLEVGFDDDRVGAVVQHKAPHDAAQFLQRKGRAGRNPATRPWTVVVLSDWGRDRLAWDAYDALFDPDLPPRTLPVDNFYVLRIQAVYALLDWLAGELKYSDRDSTWADLSGPSQYLFPNNANKQAAARERQQALATRLRRLLRAGPERTRLTHYLQRALGLGTDTSAKSVVETLLWESPRPLLLAVIPTICRRLEEQWLGEEPLLSSSGVQTRTPLREFVPGNLFDDLLVPDVELSVPTQGSRSEVQHLPALRALREFCPGNVSRHFGVFTQNKRHWLPLPLPMPGEEVLRLNVTDTYAADRIDTIVVGDEQVTVYSPRTASLKPVPPKVKDASSVSPDWEFHATPLGKGTKAPLSSKTMLLLDSLVAHLHVQGGGAQTLRYARRARGTVWDPKSRPVTLSFGIGEGDNWNPVAIGVDVHCDAIEARVRMPEDPGTPTSAERTSRLRYRLMFEAEMPECMSVFSRELLCQVVVLAVTSARMSSVALNDEGDWTARLRTAAETLGVIDVSHGPAGDDHLWEEWFSDVQVLSEIKAAVAEVASDDRTYEWDTWWRRTYTLSVANLVLAALSALCPGVDVEELTVDLSADHTDQFWLSEPSPGGTGQAEAFLRAWSEDPDGFARSLEDALVPSAVDTLDQELTALLRAQAPEVRAALGDLRSAWRLGHAAVRAAAHRVDREARNEEIFLSGPARSALSTRIVGPGAHCALVDTVVSWLDLRDHANELTGFDIDSRTLGALLADSVEVDDVLHLGTDVTEQRRSRAIANVLWPWGASARTRAFGYGARPDVSLAVVRRHVSLGPEVVEVTPWDDERRKMVHDALREHGELVLRVSLVKSAVLRSVLLDLQTQPIEVGTLLCHPLVVGVRTKVNVVEARILLRETA